MWPDKKDDEDESADKRYFVFSVSTTNKGDGTITKREGEERVEVRIAGGQERREEKKKRRGVLKDFQKEKKKRMGSREGVNEERAAGVARFNWALGSGTSSDNIKGQIYIKCCWETLTRVCKCCWAERGGGRIERERPLEAPEALNTFQRKEKGLFFRLTCMVCRVGQG